MARTAISLTTPIGSYPTLPVSANAADINMQATSGSSGSNGNQIAFGASSRLCVIVWNTDAANPYTILFSSIVDSFNRTGDIGAYTLQAADHAVFILERAGWVQSDGNVYLESNNAAIKVGAFAI